MQIQTNLENFPVRIVIEGITEEGKVFRPSDWAERMSGSLCTFKHHRIHYSPMLKPSVHDGNKCVVVDPILQKTHPDLFEYILDFAKKNRLKICQIED